MCFRNFSSNIHNDDLHDVIAWVYIRRWREFRIINTYINLSLYLSITIPINHNLYSSQSTNLFIYLFVSIASLPSARSWYSFVYPLGMTSHLKYARLQVFRSFMHEICRRSCSTYQPWYDYSWYTLIMLLVSLKWIGRVLCAAMNIWRLC